MPANGPDLPFNPWSSVLDPFDLLFPRKKGGTGVNPGTTPTSIAGLLVWYRADAGISPGSDGQAVATWSDQSGNSISAVQAVGGNQPVLKLNIQNGLPVVRFDGIASFMTFAVQAVSDFSVFFAVKQTGDNILMGNSIAGSPQIRVGQGSVDVLSTFDGGNNPMSSTLGVAQGSWSVLEYLCVNATTTVSFFQNGTAYGSGTLTNAPSTLSELSGAQSTPVLPINGDLGEVILYNSALSVANRQGIEQWLRNRWGTA